MRRRWGLKVQWSSADKAAPDTQTYPSADSTLKFWEKCCQLAPQQLTCATTRISENIVTTVTGHKVKGKYLNMSTCPHVITTTTTATCHGVTILETTTALPAQLPCSLPTMFGTCDGCRWVVAGLHNFVPPPSLSLSRTKCSQKCC